MAHDVFVSYSQKDKPVADAVVAGLEQGGIRCWVAPRDIQPGSSWGESIVEAIGKSRFMVIILSRNSNKSKQVVREVERAVSSNVIIIPFRIDKNNPTGAMSYFLSTEHWLDALTPPLEEHIQRLTETIQMFREGGRPSSERKPGQLPTVGFSVSKKKKRILIAAALLLCVAIGGGIALSKWQPGAKELALVGSYPVSGTASGIFMEDKSTAYVAGSSEGILAISTENPAEPELLWKLTGENAYELALDEDRIFVIRGEFDRTLASLLLTGGDGALPDVATDLSTPSGGSLYHMVLDGDYLHLTGHNYWGIYDISNMGLPVELFSWMPEGSSGNPCNILIREQLAYVGAGWDGLYIFDLSDMENPVQLSHFDTSDWIIGMDEQDGVLVLSLGESGMMTVDISDPSRPLALGTLALPAFSGELAIAGSWSYILFTDYENPETPAGFTAVNIDKPQNPELGPTYTDLEAGVDIQAFENWIFVSDEAKGLQIFKLE